MDPRYTELARQLICYSIELKQGESVLLDLQDCPEEMAIALIRETRAVNGIAFTNLANSRISRELAYGATEEYLSVQAGLMLAQMKKMDAYIAIRGTHNISENTDIPAKQQQLIMGKMRAVMNYRVNQTRWCVLRWPTPSMAQQASMSTEAFEDFYFRVCLLDYQALKPAMGALKIVMDKAEHVQIKSPGTDLEFSIKGLGSQVCGGHRNIPDGEVFTAPVKNSVNGVLKYNTPTIYRGIAFDDVALEFKNGKIIKATSNNTIELNKILDSDPGARYIGEFALGFNSEIKEPMRDILFDEKIAGSFHFTPGQAYEGEADNGNRSQVHWDMVCIQRKDYGGGEIYFDGKLIRKDGQFVPKSLQGLNY